MNIVTEKLNVLTGSKLECSNNASFVFTNCPYKLKYYVMKKIVTILTLLFTFSFSFFSESSGRTEKKGFVSYHGMRVDREEKIFQVTKIAAKRNRKSEKELLEISVRFSMPINPRSVNAQTVLLNEKPCGSNVHFHYDRKGESMRISIFNPDEEYSIEFKNLNSYNGKTMQDMKCCGIKDGLQMRF